MSLSRSTLVGVCALAVGSLGVASDGKIPIPFTAPVVAPITISGSGSYVLTRDLPPVAGASTMIDVIVASPNATVTIDLGGFTVDGTGATGAVINVVASGAVTDVTIRNGRVIGGVDGILAMGPVRSLVIEDVEISHSAGAGVHAVDVESTVVRRVSVFDCAAPGVWIDGGVFRGVRVTDSVFRRVADGVVVFPVAANIEISNNTFTELFPGPFGGAVWMAGASSCLVSQNTIGGFLGLPVGAAGIYLDSVEGCKVVNNTISWVGTYGIFVGAASAGNLLLDNVVRGAPLDGILVDGVANQVVGNVLTGCGGYGLHFGAAATANTYSGNVAQTNGGAFPCVVVPPIEVCPPPLGGGSVPPDFCNEGPANTSQCDNLMPGPLS